MSIENKLGVTSVCGEGHWRGRGLRGTNFKKKTPKHSLSILLGMRLLQGLLSVKGFFS